MERHPALDVGLKAGNRNTILSPELTVLEMNTRHQASQACSKSDANQCTCDEVELESRQVAEDWDG